MNRARLIRGVLTAILTVSGYAGLHGYGYQDGVDTTVGLDAGLVRDVATALIACAVGWFPSAEKFRTWWRTFTNADRVAELQAEIAKLREQSGKKAAK